MTAGRSSGSASGGHDMTRAERNSDRMGDHLDSFLLEKLLGTGVSERQIASAQGYHREVEGRQPISRTWRWWRHRTSTATARAPTFWTRRASTPIRFQAR